MEKRWRKQPTEIQKAAKSLRAVLQFDECAFDVLANCIVRPLLPLSERNEYERVRKTTLEEYCTHTGNIGDESIVRRILNAFCVQESVSDYRKRVVQTLSSMRAMEYDGSRIKRLRIQSMLLLHGVCKSRQELDKLFHPHGDRWDMSGIENFSVHFEVLQLLGYCARICFRDSLLKVSDAELVDSLSSIQGHAEDVLDSVSGIVPAVSVFANHKDRCPGDVTGYQIAKACCGLADPHKSLGALLWEETEPEPSHGKRQIVSSRTDKYVVDGSKK